MRHGYNLPWATVCSLLRVSLSPVVCYSKVALVNPVIQQHSSRRWRITHSRWDDIVTLVIGSPMLCWIYLPCSYVHRQFGIVLFSRRKPRGSGLGSNYVGELPAHSIGRMLCNEWMPCSSGGQFNNHRSRMLGLLFMADAFHLAYPTTNHSSRCRDLKVLARLGSPSGRDFN
jgi:hypothetical protein